MDDISAESLLSLLHRKIKLEVNHRVISGELIGVKEDIIIIRTYQKGTMRDFSVPIDDIDAIMFFSKGKQSDL